MIARPAPRLPASAVAGTPSLHEAVVDRLRDLIVQGTLAAGTKLRERVLCEELGISRTPLREALKYLASEGLVALVPNRGAIVAPIEPERIRHTFVVLAALEALAGELACAHVSDEALREIRGLHYQMLAHHARGELAEYFRCNQEIHVRIVQAGGNEPLVQVYRAVNAHARRARYMANLSQPRWDEAVKEHGEILEALCARDAPRLQRLLRQHLANKLAMVMDGLGAQAPAKNAPVTGDQ